MSDLDSFVQQLSTQNLQQPDLAVGLIWFSDHTQAGASVSVSDLAKLLHAKGLTGTVNGSRLATKLSKHSHLVRGQTAGTYKLRAASRATLDEVYSPLLGRRRVKPSDSVIPRDYFTDRRRSWQALVAEINGCYDHGFYDGAAVLCRRLIEALIVEMFKAKRLDSAIKTSRGDNMMLDGLIGVLNSGAHIKLSKSSRPALEPIKVVGDTAAHSLHHITTKQDLDGISNSVRVLISELLSIIDQA